MNHDGPGPETSASASQSQSPVGAPAGTARGSGAAPTAAETDAFWARTLAQHGAASGLERRPLSTPLRTLHVEDLTFQGFDGSPVRAWMLWPAGTAPRATVVQFLGNNTGRGIPEQWTLLPSAGYACLVMDNRGQTGPASPGATPDTATAGPHVVGRVTSGIESPETCYYRRLFVDAVGAVRTARAHPAAAGPLVVAGGSQGGATALAAAALAEGVDGAMVEVPLLCDPRRGVELASQGPMTELLTYLQTRPGEEDDVFAVLDHIDPVRFAARATAPALFALGELDPVCPAETVRTAYDAYAGPKQLVEYRYGGHEHGRWRHVRRRLAFLEERVAAAG